MAKVRYEIWALGYDKDMMCTDIEEYLGEFTDKEKAINQAKSYQSISDVYDQSTIEKYLCAGDSLEIVVETIREGDLSNTNIDTVYSALIR